MVEEVAKFAREYINHRSYRTPERKAKIREAIRSLTGRKLEVSCSTCYIEALFTILNITKMASSKYELRKGVVLQAFGHPEKTCTNNTITDELGDWYMKYYPEKAVYFTRMPRPTEPVIPTGMKIVEPKPELPEPPATPEQIIEEVLAPVKRTRKAKKSE